MKEVMWITKEVLHKQPHVVPVTILLLSASLIVLRHMTYEIETHPLELGLDDGGDVIKTFLLMITVLMLPLVALEMKIMQCADPVGLFCKFAMPVTLIHAVFLGLRLVQYQQLHYQDICCAFVGFVGALVVMTQGYRQSLSKILRCSSVWSLVGLAIMGAVATNAYDASLGSLRMYRAAPATWWIFFRSVLEVANTYIEILTFVPAVWIVCSEDSSAGRYKVDYVDTKRTATAFFLYLVGVYFVEDIMSAYDALEFSWLCSIAHLCHYALLVDFCFYVLAHIYNPEKLMGELRRWLPVDLSYDV